MRRTFIGIAVIAAIVLFVAGLIGVTRSVVRAAREQLVAPKETSVDVATLVTRVRELSRLETASMRVIHVGTLTQSYGVVPDVLGGDKITLLATGDVIAGVDLSQLTVHDAVRGREGTITLRLPPAQILVTRVDNNATRVLARDTGLMRRADPSLETRARQYAESMIRAEALRKGILTLADENAAKKLAAFLHTLGFERVRIVKGSPGPVAR